MAQGTPHIQPGDVPVAPSVLLPGDPLRARFIAETYLEDPRQFNEVRGMLGYTGTYRDHQVSVMGTGMGMPSIGIYSHELIHVFGCTRLIRVGSCGAMRADLDLYDLVIAQGASTDSNYLHQFDLPGTYAPLASYGLLAPAVAAAAARGARAHVGNVLSADIFYNADPTVTERWARMGVLAVEMETAALYANAAYAGVDALGIFTVSDNLITHTETTPAERQNAFGAMIEVALDVVAPAP